ncbi:MAG: hypothetical protein QOC99_1129 [Acidobacteriota bacterium]|nr:hypothetical protein [Acidobacteriota bacterium]
MSGRGIIIRLMIRTRCLVTSTRRRAGAPWCWRLAVLRSAVLRLAVLLCCVLCAGSSAFAQQYNPESYAGMRWRLIGPHRAGRVTAVAGIRGRPAVYYMGTPGGGVWKTTDGGVVWKPIFDDARVASIGALALAPSNPEIVYVGTGEQTEGDGVYKSTDGGATWTNVGLRETHYITSIIVDPRDPNIVVIGAFGDPTPTHARGVYKTNDGGKTWEQTFLPGDETSVADMCSAPGDARVLYASTWTRQLDPNDKRPVLESQIFKSTDEGTTWHQLSGAGLPEAARGRIGVVAAPGDGRVYAIMNQGFFRSDDAGESWKKETTDPRVVGSGYFSRVFTDPRNAEVVYVMQTTMYRSVDGGKTFEAYRGAPSGEDEHVLWIAPDDTERMILGSDQGAIISLNGGRSWSTWYNQPTGQFYHVITDEGFPYYAYASQQDSGSVVVPNRSDFGQITYRDWFSTGAFESGYIAPDPAHPNLIYSIGWYGTVLRMDRTTGQVSTVFVPGAKYHYTWETPLVFSPRDPKTLYVGMQHVLKTTDGAETWQEISPDLTEKTTSGLTEKTTPQLTTSQLTEKTAPPVRGSHAENERDSYAKNERNVHAENERGGHAENEDETEPQQTPAPGVIQSITPSPLLAGEIWVGTSTGLVQLTRDGGATWRNVTPADMPQKGRVTRIEASPLDAETAYVVASVRYDLHPYIFRTRDAGKTWQKIVNGLPERGAANVARVDPARAGLVYAGTDNGAYVSFDSGDHWQTLQLNLPTSPVRDLTIHGSDLAAATYGRGLWILDDLSPLRQLDAKVWDAAVYLFRPESAIRVRWDNWQETPLSAETPSGQNPPDGALIDYYLKSPATKEITLEIRDEHGNTVQRFSSVPPPTDERPGNAPDFWVAPPTVLSKKAGLNRFVWNLRFPHPPTLAYSFYGKRIDYIEYTLPDYAIPGQTPREQPQGPLVAPGSYEVLLTVDGETYRQPLVVTLDPRVRASQADLEAQLELAKRISDWMRTSYGAYNEAASLEAALAERRKNLSGHPQAKDAVDAAVTLTKQLEEIKDGTSTVAGFGSVNRDLARFMSMIESGDMRPAGTARDSARASCEALKNALARWRSINADELPALNILLKRYELAPLPTTTTPAAETTCGN